jgi:hypothetical protein
MDGLRATACLASLSIAALVGASCAALSGVGDLQKVDCVSACPDASSGAVPPYVAAVLADNPIAYYRLDETSGTTVYNSAPTAAPNGTFARNVTLGATAGPLANDPGDVAASFSTSGGMDSDLTFGQDFSFLGVTPFTIELWVNPTTIDTEPRHAFSKADRNANDAPVNGYNIVVRAPDGVIIERYVNSVGETSGAATLSPGVFTHLAAVYDGAALTIYANGAPSTPTADTRAMMATTTGAFAGSAAGTMGHGFVGALAELAIYDVALPAGRIAAHYAAGKP